MNVKINPGVISGKITPLSSKSVAHRSAICAFLSGQKTRLTGSFDVKDIDATISCLRGLGGNINKVDGGYEFDGRTEVENPVIDACESGSTLRFIIPLMCALGIKGSINGSKRLSNRPIKPLLQVLEAHGARFSGQSLPIKTDGKLTSGKYVIDGSVSSQFITGLLLALSAVEGESCIEIVNEAVSKYYIDITVSVMKDYGVCVETTDTGYIVKKSRFLAPDNYVVEGDWSSACFPLCMGALSGSVEVDNLNVNSRQGDKIVLDVLRQIGANVETDGQTVKVTKNELNPICFDAENYPDFVPVLSAVLASTKGVSKILNVERLKDKESDRLKGTLEMLDAFGIKAEYENNAITIYGGSPVGAVYHSPNDHRMAMAGTVLALSAKGESVITGVECVSKSYPCFFEHVKRLGGKVSVQSV